MVEMINTLNSKRLFKYCAIGILFFLGACTPESESLFDDYKSSYLAGNSSVLPNFSYAGYHRGADLDINLPKVIINPADYGAIPDDTVSDRIAIEQAINEAVKSGGKVQFEAGRFLINELGDQDSSMKFLLKDHPIAIEGHPNGTELFMKYKLNSITPSKKWSTPYILQFYGPDKEQLIGHIDQNSDEGSLVVSLDEVVGLSADQWIVISLKNNDPNLIKEEMNGLPVSPKWTNLTEEGVQIRMIHQVKEIKGSNIVLAEPLLKRLDEKYGWEVYKIERHEQLIIRNIKFRGNWKEPFIHHKSIDHDGAYSILDLRRLSNFQLINCTFTNVNRAVTIKDSAFGSVLGNQIDGNFGHSAISLASCTRVLLGLNRDMAGQWHTFGVAKPSIGNVLWRNEHTPYTSIESHGSQPRITLVDCAKGGLIMGRFGGAVKNLPNHMEKLIFWNYQVTNEPSEKFEFWMTGSPYGKVIPPVVVGLHGLPTTFATNQIGLLESMGKVVSPESLYEAQLELRFGYLPSWVTECKLSL